jgi:type IV secretory pathway VirB4 component
LYYSDSDPFSNENDLKQITQFLHKDIVEVKKLINYNHLDFLWSKDAKDDIYVEILSKLNKYK